LCLFSLTSTLAVVCVQQEIPVQKVPRTSTPQKPRNHSEASDACDIKSLFAAGPPLNPIAVDTQTPAFDDNPVLVLAAPAVAAPAVAEVINQTPAFDDNPVLESAAPMLAFSESQSVGHQFMEEVLDLYDVSVLTSLAAWDHGSECYSSRNADLDNVCISMGGASTGSVENVAFH